ncbi:nitroreductase family deazaflavin-dependent oxidoreductase [Planomonospora sp. ID91781]|uniref:nitroreductase/quinone reductase family protein n=1 Tax=Planomonospora sp. ID91781 TaxID=2738135 RepID=UPI0018C3F9C3|nr:nitroreductase/quinone reductase family protein [Planomonospora sp. ID91781]MBG0823373.1 nitroreductase family deazaflavin-dependent oxidoreductase [Planomonospora sp. ID91781]
MVMHRPPAADGSYALPRSDGLPRAADAGAALPATGIPAAGAPSRGPLRTAQNRLVNPFVRRLLRSPLHDLLSASVALVTVKGRRTGREVTVPADYVERDGELLLVSRRSRTWWRNLSGPGSAPVRVRLRGREWEGAASVSSDGRRVAETLLEMAAAPGRPTGAARPAWARDGVAIRIRLERPVPGGPGAQDAHGLWRRWFLATLTGEIAGFTLPAVVAALVIDSARLGPLAQVFLLILAGAGEGVLLGLGQAYALRGALPSVPTRAWVRATAAGAAVAWAIGAVPVLLGEGMQAVPWPLLAVMGLALLVSMGLFQWGVLRGRVTGAWRWIAASTGGWCLGLAAFGLVTTPLWQPGQPPALVALIGLLGAVVMAAAVAAVTGTALVALVRTGPRSQRRRTAGPTE